MLFRKAITCVRSQAGADSIENRDAGRKFHLSTVLIRAVKPRALVARAILAAAHRERLRRSARNRTIARVSCFLALFLLLLNPLPNRARPAVLKVPFHTVQSMILIEGKVNGNPATFLLDTGANHTIISARAYGHVDFDLHRLPQNTRGPGLAGGSLRLPADLVLAEHVWAAQRVSVMDLDDLNEMLKMKFDGLLGEDILRQFHSVRINYRTHTLELEQ